MIDYSLKVMINVLFQTQLFLVRSWYKVRKIIARATGINL